jgi:hypothetical protein
MLYTRTILALPDPPVLKTNGSNCSSGALKESPEEDSSLDAILSNWNRHEQDDILAAILAEIDEHDGPVMIMLPPDNV